MDNLNIVVRFVEGGLSANEFELKLRQKDMENLFSQNDDLPPYAASGELYCYLISKNFNSPGDLWDIQEALAEFLKSNGIEAKKTNKYEMEFKLLSKIQPRWLDIHGEYLGFMLSEAKAQGEAGISIELWLKNEIKKRFLFAKKPPKWLQSPKWLFDDNFPLLFVGQFDVSELHHDKTFVYLFFNKKTNKYSTVEQSA